MVKKIVLFLLMGVFMCVSGCSNNQTNTAESKELPQKDDSGFVGYVTSWDEKGRALVISTNKRNLGQKDKEYYTAIYFSNVPSSIKVGQKVSVEIDGLVLESMPAQSSAKSVKVFPSTIKKKTKLQEYEAVAKAMEQQSTTFQVIKNVDYDGKTKEWKVVVRTPPTVTGEWEFNEKTFVVKDGEDSAKMIEQDDGPVMKLEKPFYDLKTNLLKLYIKNNGDSLMSFGTQYHIERFKDGVWTKVPFQKDIGFTMQAIQLKPNATYQDMIGLDTLDFKREPGKYRVLKEVNVKEKQIILTADFEIH
jgi:hypothetical protein